MLCAEYIFFGRIYSYFFYEISHLNFHFSLIRSRDTTPQSWVVLGVSTVNLSWTLNVFYKSHLARFAQIAPLKSLQVLIISNWTITVTRRMTHTCVLLLLLSPPATTKYKIPKVWGYWKVGFNFLNTYYIFTHILQNDNFDLTVSSFWNRFFIVLGL
ncbi:hypothetical protein QTP88_024560 [Uroleucon formosanum]